jgi:hypothetical protein
VQYTLAARYNSGRVEPVQERFEELLRLLDENPEFLEALQDRIVDEKAILRAFQKRAEVRKAIRRQILHDELLQLSELVRQLVEAQQRNAAQQQENSRLIRQLIESQQRHEAILQEHSRLLQQLIESQQRHEAILQEHARQLQELTAQVRRVVGVQEQMARDLHDLKEWRKGFDGLRRGAELEKEVRQRARIIFAGGRGGHPESPFVSRLLKNWLRTLNGDDPILEAAADPTAADLIWSKGGKVIVVEVSVKVDRDDVDRAFARANTLRGAGIDAVPVVIGDRWTSDKVRTRAEMRGVEWYVGKTLSEGFIALRRIPDDAEDAEDE